MRHQTRLLLPVLLVACAEATAPQDQLAPEAAAQVDRAGGVLVIDDAVFMECVAEEVVFHAEVPFRSHTTQTPAGRTVYLEPFVPNSGTGTAVGQTSGTTWTLQRVVSPLVAQAGDGTGLIHFTATQYWTSDTGPDMLLFSMLHVSQNAHGDIVVEKFVFNRCQLK